MSKTTVLTAFLAITALSSAQAQSYPGQDVTVNPAGTGQVLIDPGTGQPRYIPPLRQPGTSAAPIHLHMPKRHDLHADRPQAAAPETMAEAPPAVHKPRRVARQKPVEPPVERRAAAAAQPQPAAPQPTSPGASNLDDLANLATEAPAQPAPKVTAAPKVASVPKTEPRPERTERRAETQTGGTARDVVLFAPGATDPTNTAVEAIHKLASTLYSDMSGGSARVQLMAYAGPRGEKSSDTRRLSLKRALVVRQLLIDDGVPAERIDVRALGGTDDNGPTDRVDVFLKS